MRNISINEAVCTGCGLCELVCSMCKENECNPDKSRIYIERHMMEGAMIPRICINCVDPPCVGVCPTDALRKDEVTGVVQLEHDVCNDCGECIHTCPFRALRLSPRGELMKCDLCSGYPQCVKYCPTEAVRY